MNIKWLILCIGLFILGNSSAFAQNSKEKRCKKTFENNFLEIVEDVFISITKNDTTFTNEIKYNCVHHSTYIQKTMFDKFGEWTNVNYPNNRRLPVLIWENVELLDNDNTLFTIAALGEENESTIYASVMVFDSEFNDLLNKESYYKERLKIYFGDLIRSNDKKKRSFYKAYTALLE